MLDATVACVDELPIVVGDLARRDDNPSHVKGQIRMQILKILKLSAEYIQDQSLLALAHIAAVPAPPSDAVLMNRFGTFQEHFETTNVKHLLATSGDISFTLRNLEAVVDLQAIRLLQQVILFLEAV